MTTKLTVIKIGGNVIDNPAELAAFLAAYAAVNDPKILVHGGGRVASEIGSRMGIEPRYSAGRRITDPETLELVTMVYGGLVSKRIVAGLQAAGCNAIGLSGCDGGAVRAVRRPAGEVDFGLVGDLGPDSINKDLLAGLMRSGLSPVIAPLSYDGQGGMLNTNADTIAREIAIAFASSAEVRLIYCFEKRGLLGDPEDDDSVIPEISEAEARASMADGSISAGMIPKLDNAFAARRQGVSGVLIGSAASLHDLIAGRTGTSIL